MLGFGLAVFAQVAEAKAPIVSISTSVERGNFISIGAGTKWKSKSVVVEVGVKSKKTWKWSRIASGRTDKSGKATMCSSRTFNAGTQLRLKSGVKVISTIKISKTIALSGCGYVPTLPVSNAVAPSASTTTAAPDTTPSSTIMPSTTAAPTTTIAPTTTTVAPPTTTVAPTTTTTTVPPPTPAPTAVALSAATDTGDSQSDGVTNATNLVVIGSAQANSSVQVYVDGASSGSPCTADGSGAFSCALGTVTAGTKSVTAKATGSNGESVASQSFTMVVDRTAPTATWVSPFALGPNSTTGLQLTVSENTTTLSITDFVLYCTGVNECTLSNFRGSNRNFTIDYAHINNLGNGGAVRLGLGTFSDVAGNQSTSNFDTTILLENWGPTAVFSRTGPRSLKIEFGERVFGFEVSDLLFIRGGGPGSDEQYVGADYQSLTNDQNDRTIWYVNFPMDIDIDFSRRTWSVEIVGSVTDFDGFQVANSWWQIPLLPVYE